MGTIIDYIKWRGDLDFDRDPFNVMDNIVLSIVTYVEMDEIFKDPGAGPLTLEEISSLYFEKVYDRKNFRDGSVLKDGPDLLKMIADTDRFRNVAVRNYISLNDTERTLQFAAMEFMLSENLSYIAFRGTDDTVVGWKEDFHLAMTETAAEKETVSYINRIAENNNRSYYVGGHSKGGHLAVYAAAECRQDIRDRIITIFSNDGPGFMEEVADSAAIKAILPKLVSIIPEEAIVGLLMNPVGKPIVVKSTAKSLFQHNPATWCLEGKSFVTAKGVSKGAKAFRKLIKESLGKMSREELDDFVENLFSVFDNAGAETLTDFKKGGLKSLKSIAHTIGEI